MSTDSPMPAHEHPATSAIAEFIGVFGEGGITDEDRRHLADLVRKSNGGRGKVSHRLCAEIRRRRHRGESSQDLLETIPLDITVSAINHHASGRCCHYVDVPEVDTNGPVTDLLCGVLRQARWMGILPSALAEAIPTDITRSSISHHTTGACTHETSVPPYTRRTVSAEQCREWCERRAEGEPMPDIAATTPFEYTTVAAHTNGECNHEIEVPEGGSLDRRARCMGWREAVESGRAPGSVADETGVSEELVRRHITGACEHGFDITEQPPLRYNGVEWVSASELWGGREGSEPGGDDE